MFDDMNMGGLAERLQKLSMLMHRLNRPAPMPHGPRGHAQERALNQIALRDGLTQTELMERLGVQRSTMSEMVDKLERSGLIERRPGAEDRRQVNLYISESGRQHLERLNMEGMRFDPFEILNAQEQEEMAAMLDRLIAYAEAECSRRGLPVHPPRPVPGSEPPFGMPVPPPFRPDGHISPEPPFRRGRRLPADPAGDNRPVYLGDDPEEV